MARQFRRVVTGHDASGKAIVLSDGPAPFMHVSPNDPDWYSADIWRPAKRRRGSLPQRQSRHSARDGNFPPSAVA